MEVIMKHSRQGVQICQVIYQEKYLKLSTLKALTVPRVYSHELALMRFILELERSGDAILEKVSLRVRQRIIGVALSEMGVKRWIQGVRDDICRPQKVDYSTRPVEVKRIEKEESPQMPCKARLTKCFHDGCYLRFQCSIRPEYKQIMEMK